MNTFDSDHLKTFTAIAETGSFSGAATRVHKTQSAVSMQMKRLEESVGRSLFIKQGRRNRLTREGDRLLDYATRLVQLNEEAMRAFSAPSLSGLVRLGTPDDYAERFLPPILARFTRSHPGVELEVLCAPSLQLTQNITDNELDLAIITQCDSDPVGQVIRSEQLLWVSSRRNLCPWPWVQRAAAGGRPPKGPCARPAGTTGSPLPVQTPPPIPPWCSRGWRYRSTLKAPCGLAWPFLTVQTAFRPCPIAISRCCEAPAKPPSR